MRDTAQRGYPVTGRLSPESARITPAATAPDRTAAAIRPGLRLPDSAVFVSILFAVLASHRAFLHLPYFWDEAGYFVPAARDLLNGRGWIPSSIEPNIHPPGLAAYLALAWKLAGYAPETTRTAMLLLGATGLFAAYLLAKELARGQAKFLPHLATALLFVSPVFFMQSMLAQLDAPAMLLTTLALLSFLRRRVRTAAVACTVLVLVKETGIIVPAVFAGWLIAEGRRRDACWFAAPGALLLIWIAILRSATGHWSGNSEFAEYNLFYPLHPARVVISLARRAYYLFMADGHWIGTAAIMFAWRNFRVYRTREWRIAGSLALAQALLVILFGGACLERYLLPVMPILYAAMAVGISLQPPPLRLLSCAGLITFLAAGLWINPPYPFPYENNFAMVDFLGLHRQTAEYLERVYPDARVTSAWPLTLELADPSLGLPDKRFAVHTVAAFTTDTLKNVDWPRVQVFVTFSREWHPRTNLAHIAPLYRFWEKYYGPVEAEREEIRRAIPLRLAARFERRGQWVDIYVKYRATSPGG